MGDDNKSGTEDVIEVVDEREAARRRLQARRDFGSHLVSYVVVNAFLIGVWAVTGGGYFWPVWVIACWGMGLVLHAWDVFWRRPLTEADIDAELERRRR
jgi:hypothetical protein